MPEEGVWCVLYLSTHWRALVWQKLWLCLPLSVKLRTIAGHIGGRGVAVLPVYKESWKSAVHEVLLKFIGMKSAVINPCAAEVLLKFIGVRSAVIDSCATAEILLKFRSFVEAVNPCVATVTWGHFANLWSKRSEECCPVCSVGLLNAVNSWAAVCCVELLEAVNSWAAVCQFNHCATV